MPYETRGQFQEELGKRFSGNIQNVLGMMLGQKQQEKQRKQQMTDAIKKMLMTNVLGGKGRFKGDFDINELLQGGDLPDMGGYEVLSKGTKGRPPKMTGEDLLRLQEITEEQAGRDITAVSPDLTEEQRQEQLQRRTANLFRPHAKRFAGQFSPEGGGQAQPPAFTGRATTPDLDALKPENIPQEEWDIASDEEKRRLLTALGIL